jgi:membrane-bound serine protease (ClpP class)
MQIVDSATLWQIQNLAYLLILAAIWTTVLAVVMPGTGALEVVAGVCIFLSAIAILTLPVNLWALPFILLGFIAFLLELRRPMKGLSLFFSILFFIAGSILLFQGPQGELAGITWWVAILGSISTAGFFWFALNRYIQGAREVHESETDQVVGQLGEARTAIHRQGSVQVSSALWSARSDAPIPQGARVRVLSRNGLILTVQKDE